VALPCIKVKTFPRETSISKKNAYFLQKLSIYSPAKKKDFAQDSSWPQLPLSFNPTSVEAISPPTLAQRKIKRTF